MLPKTVIITCIDIINIEVKETNSCGLQLYSILKFYNVNTCIM